VHAPTKSEVFVDSSRELVALARIDAEALTITSNAASPSDGDIVVVGEDVVAILPLSGLVCVSEERERLQKDLEEAELEKSRAEAQLGNASFVERAPAQVVQVQRDRLAGAIDKIAVLNTRLDELARLS